MDFYEILDQVVDLLRSRRRISYRALKRQFHLDDAYIEDLKAEIIDAQRIAVDQDNQILVWTGETASDSPSAAEPVSTLPAQIELLPAEPHTPDAERRQLTVMFSDLVDSTKLSGQLDPEDYRDVVRAYQATCAEVIYRYDGWIAQHLGDALLVYFGFPHAHEDDTHRAIRAGLGMLDAMKRLNTRLKQDKGIRLAIRIGVHTGLTVVGDIGAGPKHEQLAMGETPNIASRIQSIAEPHTVAISEVTYRLVQGYFTCEDTGKRSLKGVAEPIKVYRVLGESGVQSRLDIGSARGLTPLVGREQEVGLLLERWNQVKDGHGQVVILGGEGGIGKSRLVRVLKEHVTGEPHTRWECRSSPYYQNTALYPITDLFQRTLEWRDDDSAEAKLEKLTDILQQYRLPLEETIALFAPVLSLSIPEDRYAALLLSPQRQRQKTLEAIAALLLEQAEQQPVLVIIEDLHWTDPTTLELIDLLIDRIQTASVLILLTYRPTFQPRWSSRSYLTQITLGNLSRHQIEQMAAQVAGGRRFPVEVLRQVIEKTDGVPLFVEEMTKAVLESGLLKGTGESYELSSPLTSLAIPATLQDSLMARLDRLNAAKTVAQLSAVIGRQFSYALLQIVSQLDEATLQRELGRLVESELLFQRGLPPQATYIFKHALIQDVAYQSLLKSTRQQYHQRIAQALEERFPEIVETQPELLAHHYTEAGRIASAIGYWQKAGRGAVERSAHVEGISHLTQGLEALKTLPDTPERAQQELILQTSLGSTLIATKGYAALDVEHAYKRARELCQQLGETPRLLQVLLGLHAFHVVRGELQTARELAEQCLPLAQHTQNSARLLQTHYALGMTLFHLGELALAREHLEQGLALYGPQHHHSHALQDPGVSCLSYTAWVLWHLGYPDQALERSHQALTLAQELSHPYSLANALDFDATVHQLCQEGQAVQERAEAAIVLGREQGFPFWLAWGTILQGWALAGQEQGGNGIVQMRQGLDAWKAAGVEALRSHVLALLAEVYGKTAQADEGLQVLAEALAAVDKNRERYYEAELYRLKGELLLALSMDNQAEAEACFRQALTVARHQQAKSFELRTAMSLSRLWLQQDKRTQARQLLVEVYGWFTEGFDTTDLRQAKALLDELGA